MAAEVVVGPVGDALQLAPADGEAILDVDGALRVVGELLLRVLPEPQVVGLDPVAPVPAEPLVDPVLVPVLVGRLPVHRLARVDEELQLHLLELARPEDEVPRGDLVPEAPADLRDAEGELPPHRLEDVLEVDEHPLGGLRTEIGHRRLVLDGTEEGLEHHVELARLRQRALAAERAEGSPRLAVLARLARRDLELVVFLGRAIVDPRLGVEVVRPEPPLALPAVDHRVGEPLEVAARLPDPRVHQDRRLQPEDVAPEVDDVPPPEVPDVALHLHAERTVVPGGAEPAIDLAGLEDEPPALAQGDEGIHVDHRI